MVIPDSVRVVTMPKPDWLVEVEQNRNRITVDPDTCSDCVYLGQPIKLTKHKDRVWTEVFECDIHPGCFNTKFSICCDDFTPEYLV